MTYKKWGLYVLILLSITSHAYDGYVKIDSSLSKKTWDFLPSIPKNFSEASKNELEFFLLSGDFGLMLNQSQFKLDVVRLTEPKFVNLTSNNSEVELFYLFKRDLAFSFKYSSQDAEKQFIDCYSFNGLIIGGCNNYDLKVTNNNERYEQLGESIIMIDGLTESWELAFTKAISSYLLDEIRVGLQVTDHSFDWLTPLDSISSPFILNLNIDGSSLGSLINSTLSNLPQQNPWSTYQVNLDILKDIKLSKSISLFYKISFKAFEFENYYDERAAPKNNFGLKSGIKLNIGSFTSSIYGEFYQNNLIGFEPIIFNQRTQSYFDQNFGLIGINLEYQF